MLWLDDILHDLKTEKQVSLTKGVILYFLSVYPEQLNLLTRHLFWINHFINILMASSPNNPRIFIF